MSSGYGATLNSLDLEQQKTPSDPAFTNGRGPTTSLLNARRRRSRHHQHPHSHKEIPMKYSIPQGIEHRPIAVIGAGTLGRRIALMMSTQGGEVRIFDKMQKSREDGVKFVEEALPTVLTTVPN